METEIYQATGAYLAAEDAYTFAFWIRVDRRADHGANPIAVRSGGVGHKRLELGSNRLAPSTAVGGPTKRVLANGRNGRAFASVEGDSVEDPDYAPESNDSWQFVALVVDGGDAVLWTGSAGGSLTSKELSGNWTLHSDCESLWVGGSGTCLVDELRIYSRALTSEDVAELFAEAPG